MVRDMCMAVTFVLAAVVVHANPCSSGSECPSDNEPQNLMLLLQTKLGMNVLGDELTKDALFNSSWAPKTGPRDELTKDALFNLSWAPKTVSVGAVRIPRVGADDDCRSWKGHPICYIEAPEHTLVKKWLPENATVMEFGARFGTTTCEIAKKLKNSGKLVTIEPDRQVWGFLENNVKSHDCHSHVLRGAISSIPLHMLGSGYGGRSDNSNNLRKGSTTVPTFSFDEVEKAVGFKIDTLLIDCEGCAQHMMDQIGPKIKEQIQLILLEADMPDTGGDCVHDCMNYAKFFKFLENSGFEKVEEFNDCNHERSGSPPSTWCGAWINHHAFKRKA